MKLRIALKNPNDFDPAAYDAAGVGVEVQSFVVPTENRAYTESRIALWEEKLRGFGGPVATHGPFIDLRPVSLDPGIAQLTRQRYAEHLDIAQRLGAEYAVFHSQILPTTPRRTQVLINGATGRFWRELLEESGYTGRVLIENVFEKEAGLLKEHLRSIDHPRVGMLLDVGHQKLSGEPLADWLRRLGPKIDTLHVHDNNRLVDLHEKPGQGLRETILSFAREYGTGLTLEYPVRDPQEARKDWYL